MKTYFTGFFIAVALLTTGMAPEVRDRQTRLKRVLQRLERSPTGSSLLVRARRLWKLAPHASIQPYLDWGLASKTDAILTRTFDPVTEKENRIREVRISLRENAPDTDLLLDLAHELVHATTTPSWDPYDPHLTSVQYVRTALEGKGGEVDAVLAECSVAMELGSTLGDSATFRRCQGYFEGRAPASGSQQSRARAQVTRDFYRVGPRRAEVLARVRSAGGGAEEFPFLSDESVRLYSSTGGTPYPLALLTEFEELNRIACENSERRLASQSHADSSRSSSRTASLERFLKARCGGRTK